jgi:poly(3-hydroxybutyrate) depolymerase
VKQNLCIDTSRVFGMGPANYNIWLPANTHEPIAWMQTTGMADGTTPWVNGTSTTQGAKYIAIQHATDNGCMVPADIPTWKSGNTLCYDFVGCKPGYPVRACTFNGGHTLPSGIGDMLWTFISQF